MVDKMKFKIAEFEIEEFEEVNKTEYCLRYVINEDLMGKLRDIGEIIFKSNKNGEYDIENKIKESVKIWGYEYKLLNILIDRLCKDRTVSKFTYKVVSNDITSKDLVERIGGKLINECELSATEANALIYEIKPFVINHTFLTKYITPFENGEWLTPTKIYSQLVRDFADDVNIFIDINEQLGIKEYYNFLKNNGVLNDKGSQDIYNAIDTMSEPCLYASVIYSLKRSLRYDLAKGYMVQILKRIEQIHNG